MATKTSDATEYPLLGAGEDPATAGARAAGASEANFHHMRAINANRKAAALAEEVEAVRGENTVIRTAVYDLIRERQELYKTFSHLATRWGEGEAPSIDQIKEQVKAALDGEEGVHEAVSAQVSTEVTIGKARERMKRSPKR